MWSENSREKERERRALLSCVGLSVSFEFRYCLNMVCLWNEGALSFLLCHLVCVNSLQGRAPPFE